MISESTLCLAASGFDGMKAWTMFESRMPVSGFGTYLLSYKTVLILTHVFRHIREYSDQSIRIVEIELRTTRAKLNALRTQLHPHFLFNALHSLSGLTLENPVAAERIVSRLKIMVEQTMEESDLPLVSLKKEMESLNNYLEIMKVRFENRLNVRIEIDPDALEVEVPVWILQPIVENAFRHGASSRHSSSEVVIEGKRRNGVLELSVKDDGPGIRPGTPYRPGIGLSNTKERLIRIYGSSHQMDVGNRLEGGFQVKLEIPVLTGGVV